MKNIKAKIAKVLIPCAIIIFLTLILQPDMMNPVTHREEETKLKQIGAYLKGYFKKSKLNRYPENPRDFNIDPQILGVLHVPSNWDDFNEISTFDYVSKLESTYNQSPNNIIFVSKTISHRGTKVALFEDGHIEHLTPHQQQVFFIQPISPTRTLE